MTKQLFNTQDKCLHLTIIKYNHSKIPLRYTQMILKCQWPIDYRKCNMAVLNQTTNTSKETMNNHLDYLAWQNVATPNYIHGDKTYHILNRPDLNGIITD
jgi:hypothetical protein